MKNNKKFLFIFIATIAVVLPFKTFAFYFENFDSYTAIQSLVGQGSWTSANPPFNTIRVVNDVIFSPPNSVSLATCEGDKVCGEAESPIIALANDGFFFRKQQYSGTVNPATYSMDFNNGNTCLFRLNFVGGVSTRSVHLIPTCGSTMATFTDITAAFILYELKWTNSEVQLCRHGANFTLTPDCSNSFARTAGTPNKIKLKTMSSLSDEQLRFDDLCIASGGCLEIADAPVKLDFFYPNLNSFVDLKNEWQGIFTISVSSTLPTPEPFESYAALLTFGTSTNPAFQTHATIGGFDLLSINEIASSDFPYINILTRPQDMMNYYTKENKLQLTINAAVQLFGFTVDGGSIPISQIATTTFKVFYQGRTTTTQKFPGFDLFSELTELEPVLVQEKDCSALWGGIFSSSTLEALYCVGEKLITKTGTILFSPSTSTRDYFFNSFRGLTQLFPFNIAFQFDKVVNKELDILTGDIIINRATTTYDKLVLPIGGNDYTIVSSSSFKAKVGETSRNNFHNIITNVGWVITGLIVLSILF